MSTFTWGGRQWGAGDLAAFKAWLQKRGANYANWSRRHPGAAASLKGGGRSTAGLSYVDIARQRADEAVKPEVDYLTGERERQRTRDDALLQHQSDTTAAAAEILKSIAPGVQRTYSDAGDAVASYGRGLGDIQNDIQAGEREKLAGVLGKSGASAEQLAQVNEKVGSDAAGDVVYGVGGYLPAADLQTQGAAATAFAQGLPAQAVSQGNQTRGEMAQAMLDRDMELLAQIQAAKAKIPGLQNDFLQQLIENQRAERALQVQEGYFGQSQRKTDADLTGVDPVTGMPTLETQATEAKAGSEAAAARQGAVKEREDDFASARVSLFDEVKGLGEKTKVSDPTRPWAPPVEKVTLPEYAAAKKALFDKYKYLLRYASRSGQAALKRRLNQMIDEALASAGIKPKPKKVSAPRGTRVRRDKGKPRGG